MPHQQTNTRKMSTKLVIGFCVVLFTFVSCNGQTGEKETEVMLETTAGNIRIKLYNDTPVHRDNFIQNVKDGKYDGVTWHRIIRNFMIQTGEQPVQFDANGDTIATDPSEWITAEIHFPKHYHKRGVVAAAREGDDVNPEKKSDHYQFYIVTGMKQSDVRLANAETHLNKKRRELVFDSITKQPSYQAQLREMNKKGDKRGMWRVKEEIKEQTDAIMEERTPIAYTKEQKKIYQTIGDRG